MPIFYQQDIDDDTRLGIWKIEEEEDFFLQSVVPQRNVSHPHKKLQHLAGRYLLKYLFPDFPLSLILIADTRKPYLENEAYHFSISHCGDYAAVIVSKTRRVGVDIEMPSYKVEKIKHKFLTMEELGMVTRELSVFDGESFRGFEMITLLWSCKEAVFKWYGLGGVDFKEHMTLTDIMKKDDFSYQTGILFKKRNLQKIHLRSRFFLNNLCLSFVVTG
jgi:phosphopantetheinyl transferase